MNFDILILNDGALSVYHISSDFALFSLIVSQSVERVRKVNQKLNLEVLTYVKQKNEQKLKRFKKT